MLIIQPRQGLKGTPTRLALPSFLEGKIEKIIPPEVIHAPRLGFVFYENRVRRFRKKHL
jgi:hypothetical protein